MKMSGYPNEFCVSMSSWEVAMVIVEAMVVHNTKFIRSVCIFDLIL